MGTSPIAETCSRTLPEPSANLPEKPARSRPYFWRDREGDVVVEEQPRLAVYMNTRGAIVIREESPEGDDEDPFVRLRPECVEKLIAALRAERDGKR